MEPHFLVWWLRGRIRGKRGTLRTGSADLWQAQHFVNLEVHSSWQTQHFANLEVQILWQARFVNLEVQFSWQAQHFVSLDVQISWRAQHFANLEVQISWQAQVITLDNHLYTSYDDDDDDDDDDNKPSKKMILNVMSKTMVQMIDGQLKLVAVLQGEPFPAAF